MRLVLACLRVGGSNANNYPRGDQPSDVDLPLVPIWGADNENPITDTRGQQFAC